MLVQRIAAKHINVVFGGLVVAQDVVTLPVASDLTFTSEISPLRMKVNLLSCISIQ